MAHIKKATRGPHCWLGRPDLNMTVRRFGLKHRVSVGPSPVLSGNNGSGLSLWKCPPRKSGAEILEEQRYDGQRYFVLFCFFGKNWTPPYTHKKRTSLKWHREGSKVSHLDQFNNNYSVHLTCQPTIFFSHTKSAQATNHEPASSTFFITNQRQLSVTAKQTKALFSSQKFSYSIHHIESSDTCVEH
jgi:hypothetical protein